MNNQKFPKGIWEKAAEIYNTRYKSEKDNKRNLNLTGKQFRNRHYRTYESGIEKAIEEAITELSNHNNRV